jgi:hypothetical protein
VLINLSHNNGWSGVYSASFGVTTVFPPVGVDRCAARVVVQDTLAPNLQSDDDTGELEEWLNEYVRLLMRGALSVLAIIGKFTDYSGRSLFFRWDRVG